MASLNHFLISFNQSSPYVCTLMEDYRTIGAHLQQIQHLSCHTEAFYIPIFIDDRKPRYSSLFKKKIVKTKRMTCKFPPSVEDTTIVLQ